MAIMHGGPGRYSRSEASRLLGRKFSLLLALMGVMGFVAGIAVTASLERNYWIAIPLLGVMAIAMWWGSRAPSRYLDELDSEIRRHLAGADGEAVVAHTLDGLSGDFHVFNNVELHGSSDMDHIVIGPTGVWCISTKAHKGVYRNSGTQHTHNGNSVTFGADAIRDTLRLRDLLGPDLRGAPPYFQAVVALPFAWVEGDGANANPAVVGVHNLNELIDADRPRRRASVREIAEVVQAVKNLLSRRAIARAGVSSPHEVHQDARNRE